MSSPPPRWAATLAAAVTCGAFAIWNPPVRDLAAHTFRAELFEDAGFAIWNNSWYGGHYLISYSVLFPPLAALLSPVWVAALSGIASAWLFDGLVRQRWGPYAGWAALWFGALSAVALLGNGWLVFALGVALALGALRALQRGRRAWALALGAATALASPVAAAFLALVGVGAALAGGGRGRWLWWLAAAALIPLAALGLLFPEAGEFPYWFSAFWPLPLFCALALVAMRGLATERDVRVVVVLYLLAAAFAWLVPNPLGGNLTRLGSLFGGPLLLAILLARRPARLRTPVALAALAVALGWQVVTPIPDTLQSLGDPATKRSYYRPVAAWLAAHGGERDRIEVPYTFNHWETAYLAPRFSLARGWLRQLDIERNELFYEGELTHARYRRWLAENAIRWVAASTARLDYSAQEEDDLIRARPSYLRLRATLRRWRIYEAIPSAPMVGSRGGGRARLIALEPDSFALEVVRPGLFVVRVRHTPYWEADAGACAGKAGEWTLVRAPRAGRVTVRASLDAPSAWRVARGAAPKC
jgi:hypothetical protein